MPVYTLQDDPVFPPVSHAEPGGLLAVGGDLSPLRLLNAYASGIFPWFNKGEPILWWSPDPRLVLFPKDLIVHKSMRPILRSGRFRVTFDQDFAGVIKGCAQQRRPGQRGTWILPVMVEAYVELHRLGFAHSVEVWKEEALVGGLYGISMGHCFFGESMFARESNASKVGFIHLVRGLDHLGFELVDCQQSTHHLASLGAVEISRVEFMERLGLALKGKTARGNWGELEGLRVEKLF